MALTNLSSQQAIIDKLYSLGVWSRTVNQVCEIFEKTTDLTAGQIQIVVAACELLANLSLCQYV
jgi:hypothetical protein